jgi:uncharacterized protein
LSGTIERLFALQQIDTRIGRARTEIDEMDHGRTAGRAAKVAKRELEQAQETLRRRQADQKDAELQLQQLEAKLEKARKSLFAGKVTNPKELRALERDIESLERQRGRLDEQVLETMTDVERLVAAAEASSKALSRGVKLYRRTSAEHEERQKTLEAELAELEAQRGPLAASIPPILLKSYGAKRAGPTGVAVAAVDGAVCAACRVAVPSVSLQKLADAEAVVLCDNCGRILYLGAARPSEHMADGEGDEGDDEDDD